MSEIKCLIEFDATTASTIYNDGLEDLHAEIRYAWKRFTGGYVNTVRCDPPWHASKGVPIPRTFTTVAYIDENSAADELLKRVGPDGFLRLFLAASGEVTRRLKEKGASAPRITVPDAEEVQG